jgi:alginate O-acetyltransferase complex protein AlgI
LPFISLSFLFLFLPIALVFHFFAARFGERSRLCALIAVSFLFCAAWNVWAAALLAGSILVNYIIGGLIDQAREEEHAFQTNMFFAMGIAFNLGVLGVFRYAQFFIDNIDTLPGMDFSIGKILAPIGVLFFSCDQISYLADLRRGKMRHAGFLPYAAFSSFFPRLAAGPLLRFEAMEPQFEHLRPDAEDLAVGLTTFVIGLAKVLLLAGAVAPFATIVFAATNASQPIEFFAAWTGVLAFACQIYFDLSGYSDMAIGLGRCFGFRLPINFRSPYKAANIAEFWRRWNITLADFLRDYVYLPLGGNRRGSARASLNLTIAMVLGGLWYGAGRMFVAWALLHSFYILSYRVWRMLCAQNITLSRLRLSNAGRTAGIIITFGAVTLGWIVFRSADSASGLDLFLALFGRNGAALPSDFAPFFGPALQVAQDIGINFSSPDGAALARAWLSIVVCLGVIFLLPNTEALLSAPRISSTEEDGWPHKLLPLRWAALPFWSVSFGTIAFVCLVSLTGAAAIQHWRF